MAASSTPPPTTTFPGAPPPEPAPRRPRRRLAGPLLITAVLLAAVVAVVLGLTRPDDGSRHDVGFEVPHLAIEPGTAIPAGAAVAPSDDGATAATRPTPAAVRDWATTLSERIEIPTRSLVAYAEAELAVRVAEPGCKLNWATLAGVGRVESHHGRYGGTQIGEDGQLTPAIIGVPLDGSPGVRAVRDTDGGRLDGDLQWDRAVGAMQFLPATWERWGTRADGDGAEPNPQDIDDAALSAAFFLCSRGGDLSDPAGWWDAVLGYNGSVSYGQSVFSGADAYGKAAADSAHESG